MRRREKYKLEEIVVKKLSSPQMFEKADVSSASPSSEHLTETSDSVITIESTADH